MFIIINLKNTREKHSTENKSPRRQHSAKSLLEQHSIKLYLMIVSSSPSSSCFVQGSFYAA